MEKRAEIPHYVSMGDLVGDPNLYKAEFLDYAQKSRLHNSEKPICVFVNAALLANSPFTIHVAEVYEFLREMVNDYDPERNFDKTEELFTKEKVNFRLRMMGKSGDNEARKVVIKNLFTRLIKNRVYNDNLDLVSYSMEDLAGGINSTNSPFGLYHVEGASRYVLAKKPLDPSGAIMIADYEMALREIPKRFARPLSKICLLRILPNDGYKGNLYRLDYLAGLPHSQVNLLFTLASVSRSTIPVADLEKIFPKMEIKPGTPKFDSIVKSRLKDLENKLAEKGIGVEFSFDSSKGVKLNKLEYTPSSY